MSLSRSSRAETPKHDDDAITGGQKRKEGSILKEELRLLERRRRFYGFLNIMEFLEQERRRDRNAIEEYVLRDLLLKRHHKKRLQYLLESKRR
jgi:predicted nucleotidyltransferase